jgi:hypothetical protein
MSDYPFIAKNGLLARDDSQVSGSLNVSGSITAHSAVLRGNTANVIELDRAGTPKWYIGNTSTGLSIDTGSISNGSAKLFVAFSGSVGIGTTNPTAKLHVSGSGGTAIDIRTTGRMAVGEAGSGGMWVDGTTSRQFFGSNAATRMGVYNLGWRMLFDDSGSIAINTSTFLSQSAVTLIRTSGFGTLPGAAPFYESQSLFIGNVTTAYGMHFGVANTGRGWIQCGRTDSVVYFDLLLQTHGGNVGIGTTNPSLAKLQVGGNISATSLTGSLSGSAAAVSASSTGANTNYHIPLVASTGIQPLVIDNGSNIHYNPSTNILTVPTVVGNLTGTATTASNLINTAFNTTASSPEATKAFFYVNSTGAQGFPTEFGCGLGVFRNPNTSTSANGSFIFNNPTIGQQLQYSTYTSGSGWSAWRTLLHSANLSTYVADKTGSGASGTWGISITGTAPTSSLLETIGSYKWTASMSASALPMGIAISFATASMGWDSFGSIVHMRGYDGSGGGTMQMFIPYGSSPTLGGSSVRFRLADFSANSSNPSWSDWKYFIDSGTISTASVAFASAASSSVSASRATSAASAASSSWATAAINSFTSSLLTSLGTYVWDVATSASLLPFGVACSFVSAVTGSFPNYGTVLHVRGYSGGGGSMQLYAPYGHSSSLGGTALRFRTADYAANYVNPSWSDWKFLIDSSTISTASVAFATSASYAAVAASANTAVSATGATSANTLVTTTSAFNFDYPVAFSNSGGSGAASYYGDSTWFYYNPSTQLLSVRHLEVAGNVTATILTASFAASALTASFITASAIRGTVTTAATASYVIIAQSAITASSAISSSNALFANTASHALQAVSASYSLSSSYALHATTAFNADAADAIEVTDNNVVNGERYLTWTIGAGTSTINMSTSKFRVNPSNGSISASLFSGSLKGNADTATTASYSLAALSASYALSSSYALSASYARSALSSSYALSASYAFSASHASGALHTVSASYAHTASFLENFHFDRNTFTMANLNTHYPIVYRHTGSFESVFVDYTVTSGSNRRCGQLMGTWSSGSIAYTHVTSSNIGTTLDVTMSLGMSASVVQLSGSCMTFKPWTVKAFARYL